MRLIFLFFIAHLLVSDVHACDICGCSANSHSLGVMPLFAKHFVGLRYNFRSFRSSHTNLLGEQTERSDEYYHSIDLWARYNPHKRLQLFAFLPYQVYQQNKNAETTTNAGFGDLLLLANINFFDNGDSIRLAWRHLLQGGIGIKLPTGQWQSNANNSGMNANLQLGSGSFDIPLNLSYTLRHGRRWGWQTELSYRFNLHNKDRFKFGNQFTANQQVFYSHSVARWNFMPSVGLHFLHTQNNRSAGITLDYSGGNLLSVTAGFQVFYKKAMLGLSARQPVYQGMAGGDSKARLQFSANLIVFL